MLTAIEYGASPWLIRQSPTPVAHISNEIINRYGHNSSKEKCSNFPFGVTTKGIFFPSRPYIADFISTGKETMPRIVPLYMSLIR